MKTAILIIDSGKQIVLTPETETERTICKMIKESTLEVFYGSFYVDKCNGGWNRQYKDTESAILLLSDKTHEKQNY